MTKIMNLLTDILAWFLKNVNMVVGIIGAVSKLVCGLLNIFQPDKDKLVDTIQSWTDKIQKGLFKASKLLKKFAG